MAYYVVTFQAWNMSAHDSLWALGVTNTITHFFLGLLITCFWVTLGHEHLAGLCRLRSSARTHLALDLSHEPVGSCYLFFMPRMLTLLSMLKTVHT